MLLAPLAQPVDTALVIAGFALPAASPLFLGILAIHVLAGLTAVLGGFVAMRSRKSPGRHRASGNIFYWALLVAFATNLLLAIIRWPHNNLHLIILGTLAVVAAYFGRRARHRALPGWRRTRIPCMGTAYALLLTAFYVDNGPQIPVWRSLPPGPIGSCPEQSRSPSSSLPSAGGHAQAPSN